MRKGGDKNQAREDWGKGEKGRGQKKGSGRGRGRREEEEGTLSERSET